jgi:uncharacterized membrane protein YbhN (UPF0104 family)
MDRHQMRKLMCRVGPAALAVAAATVGLRVALRGLDWPSFQAQIHRLEWRWLALAVVFDVMSYVAQGMRWRLLLNGASAWQTTRAIYAGLFINEMIPLRPGEAIRAWLAARDLKVGLWNIVPSMLAERLMDGFWLTAALLATLIFAPLPSNLVRAIWVLATITSALVLAVWCLAGRRVAFLRTVKSGLRNPRALLVSGSFLVAQGLAFWAVSRADHLSLGLVAAFVVMVVVRIGTMIPGAPANLGTHQFSTVLGLSLYGVPQPQAAGFSLVVFTVLTIPLLVLGLCACLSAGLTWGSIRQSIARDTERVANGCRAAFFASVAADS